ncbi:hypothetical protein MKX01_018282 [Papaver californicum]|nr:hypothetical protein MKX01_018282 [Papaver californicum]
MNRISRFSVCRSLFRRNPFSRWSPKPISSSLISINPTSSNLITLSKFHHTFNYPPQIFSTPGNHFRKFSGAAAAKCGKIGFELGDWYRAVGRFKGESSESENESDTLPTAQDQIAMPVGDVSAVVAENLADITYQGGNQCTSIVTHSIR